MKAAVAASAVAMFLACSNVYAQEETPVPEVSAPTLPAPGTAQISDSTMEKEAEAKGNTSSATRDRDEENAKDQKPHSGKHKDREKAKDRDRDRHKDRYKNKDRDRDNDVDEQRGDRHGKMRGLEQADEATGKQGKHGRDHAGERGKD